MVFGLGKAGPDGVITSDREKATGLVNYSMTRVSTSADAILSRSWSLVGMIPMECVATGLSC
jgi:hypothetical protein